MAKTLVSGNNSIEQDGYFITMQVDTKLIILCLLGLTSFCFIVVNSIKLTTLYVCQTFPIDSLSKFKPKLTRPNASENPRIFHHQSIIFKYVYELFLKLRLSRNL